jgi:hypothetical protein
MNPFHPSIKTGHKHEPDVGGQGQRCGHQLGKIKILLRKLSGGYMDWRMPTRDELAGLYDAGKTSQNPPTEGCGGGYHLTELIHLTCANLWASEEDTSGTGPRMTGHDYINFSYGLRKPNTDSIDFFFRALRVRSGKSVLGSSAPDEPFPEIFLRFSPQGGSSRHGGRPLLIAPLIPACKAGPAGSSSRSRPG